MKIPACLAIIPDGNRTWARTHKFKSAAVGHTQGLKNTRQIFRSAFEAGVVHIAFWAAGKANLEKRDRGEIAHLFTLLKNELRRQIKEGEREQVRLCMCGEWREYTEDPELFDLAEKAQSATAKFTERTLTILMGYSGGADLYHAFKAQESARAAIAREEFEHWLQRNLLSADVPEVDLVIRTKGDQPHLSDAFLFWQTRNAEYVFSPKLWPDFSVEDLHAAFEEYGRRTRNCGA